MPVVNANSVDPDAASDLGQHCLPMSHLWHNWVKGNNVFPVGVNSFFFFFFFFLVVFFFSK